jgi:hypothetical protein
MPHPSLQRDDIHPIPQMVCGKGVPELMEEEILAIGPFRTFVAVFRDTLSTIQFSSVGNTFYNALSSSC